MMVLIKRLSLCLTRRIFLLWFDVSDEIKTSQKLLGAYSIFIGLFYLVIIFIFDPLITQGIRIGPFTVIAIILLFLLIIAGINLLEKRQPRPLKIAVFLGQLITEILTLPDYGFLFIWGTIALAIFTATEK